jgi:hypothetical protein
VPYIELLGNGILFIKLNLILGYKNTKGKTIIIVSLKGTQRDTSNKGKKNGYNRFQFKSRIQSHKRSRKNAGPPFFPLVFVFGRCGGLPEATGGYRSPGDRVSGRGGTGMPSCKSELNQFNHHLEDETTDVLRHRSRGTFEAIIILPFFPSLRPTPVGESKLTG